MEDFPRPDWTNIFHSQSFHGDSGAFAGDKLDLNLSLGSSVTPSRARFI